MVRRQLLISLIVVAISPWFWQVSKSKTMTKWDIDPVWKVDQFEVADINRFRSMHADSRLGQVSAKVHYNKVSFVAEQTLSRALPYWDLGYYFTANHPRERAGVLEIEKFWWWSLPLFLVGLYKLIGKQTVYRYLAVTSMYIIFLSALGLQNDISMIPVGLIITWIMGLCFV